MEQFNGTIKYIDTGKGFGFITPSVSGKPDVFFSFDSLRGNAARMPIKGETVVYEEGTGKRGPLAVEDYTRDRETAARLEAAKQTAQAGQKAFREALYERNRQWHAARGQGAS